MPKPSPLHWSTTLHRVEETAGDRPLTQAALQCFLQPGEASLAALEALLSDDPRVFMRQGALVVQTANAILDEEGRQLAAIFAQQGKPVVCSTGCSGCCHQLVLCLPFETEIIAACLLARPRALSAFTAAYPGWDAATAHLVLKETTASPVQSEPVSFRQSYLAWARRLYGQGHDDGSHTLDDYHVPCPFLDAQHQCRIYPARPYACRTSIALDAACPNPEDGRPGSRNMHFSLYTTHQQARKAVTDCLLQRLASHFMPEPMPDLVFRSLSSAD